MYIVWTNYEVNRYKIAETFLEARKAQRNFGGDIYCKVDPPEDKSIFNELLMAYDSAQLTIAQLEKNLKEQLHSTCAAISAEATEENQRTKAQDQLSKSIVEREKLQGENEELRKLANEMTERYNMLRKWRIEVLQLCYSIGMKH